MTTGRINQVSIVHQCAEAHRLSPQRSRWYQRRGSPKFPQITCLEKRTWRNRCRQPIQLPPLSSPRRGPQQSLRSVAAHNKPAACTPQEEESRRKLTQQKAADSLRGCPQRSGEIFGIASHPQTAKMVPTQGNRVGLQLSDASRVVAKTPPYKNPTMTEPRVAR
jgi:hypothetical protein